MPRLFDRPKYRERNIIERMFGWLKENRRIGTRYNKLAKTYAAMVTLACSLRCLYAAILFVQNLEPKNKKSPHKAGFGYS
ncbi:ISPs1, transposase OrfB [Pseudomonas coronafaciens pv. oryzae]|nr:ISPs1, transposase OrfB [Pseudomonas coronafaciens pv. oryzae]KPZ21900.1 ISPs1a [Pseudomonas coronafaciens pv. zizaniae]RMT06744.1 ISPs1, transposase OrfB [Pseudomonas coronafaciens pv. oryzae]